MCCRRTAMVVLLSTLACLPAAGCGSDKDKDKGKGTSQQRVKPDEIVVDWWETKDRKEKDLLAVIVGARIPSDKLFVPSPKNPGSYEWSYDALKLICSDGSSIIAEGVHKAYHGDEAPFYKMQSLAREPGRYALTQYDASMFLVEKKKLAAGGMKFQVKDLPPIPLTEDKRGRR